jgi:hypothetical protein
VASQGEGLHPCGQVQGEGHDGGPDRVLVEPVQRQVP